MRKVNGIISLALVLVVGAHALPGLFPFAEPSVHLLQTLGWAIVCLGVGHALLSVGTSTQMLTDTVRPPSEGKKRHLVLKWATGLAVAGAVALHACASAGMLPGMGKQALAATVVLVLALTGMHVYVGTRSLLKDIGLPRSWKSAARALVAAITIAACAATIVLAG